jgi:integrase
MKRRPDGRWQKRITLPNGKSKLIYSSAATERAAVKDFNDQMLRLEKDVRNSSLFSVVADSWNSEYREKVGEINYRKATRASYNKIVDHFGDFLIEEITPQMVNHYINSLIKKDYSQKTVATAKSVLSMIFDYAVLYYKLPSNPVQIIKLPKNLPKTAREMPSDDVLSVINSNYTGFAFLPYFLLNTGLRKSEALALDYSDIDFENKLIKVNKHLIHDGNRPVLENKTKTENSIRSVILLDRVAEKLPRNKNGTVFCNDDGSYLTMCQFKKRWEKWEKEYGIKVTAHQLRHGFATMLFEAGIDLKDAQDLMGHSDIKTTQSIYTHIRDKRKEETARKLNEFSFK